MKTEYKKIHSFNFRIFAICLIIFTFLKMDTYALDNHKAVISPYWQSDSSSYTFIAVSHPSLDHMASQIGVKMSAIQSDNTLFNTAASFTISAGATQRVFIIRTGHSIINPTIIPSATFIVGTTDFKYGNIIIEPIADPQKTTIGTYDGDGFRDVTMLSFFGGIVFDSNTTGFSMEFVGDVHDSTTTFIYNEAIASGVN